MVSVIATSIEDSRVQLTAMRATQVIERNLGDKNNEGEL